MKRDSFVFYKSWLNVISDLPADVQLEIYQATMEYAINGNLTELKPMAKVAFAFIKQDIDRAFEKYEEVQNVRSDAGRMGNLKRWNNDLYNDVSAGDMTLDEAETIANGRKSSQNIANYRKRSQTSLNVNVNDNVNDNVNNNPPTPLCEKNDFSKNSDLKKQDENLKNENSSTKNQEKKEKEKSSAKKEKEFKGQISEDDFANDKEHQTEGESLKNNLKNAKKSKLDEFLSETDTTWVGLVREWLEYKQERKENYKSKRSVKAFESQLKRLSNNNLSKAKQVIEQSMGNNWAGIFELKTSEKKQAKQHPFTQPIKGTVYEDF